MSSWASPFPPDATTKRRSSRSRSPERRPVYEREWRDKDWSEYERERSEWEFKRGQAAGFRPRSRSPGGGYDARRNAKRRRSMSPPFDYGRDRYEPRPRFGDEYADYRGPQGRYSPPRGYPPNSPPRPRGPIDPHELDYPATFRYFSDWFRLNYPGVVANEDSQAKSAEADPNTKTISPMRKRYDEYRKGITNQQIQILFDHHKKSAWFLERYDLSEPFVTLRKRTRKIGWKGKIEEFIQKLDEGQFDPVLELDATPAARDITTSVISTENINNTGGSQGENGDVDMAGDEVMKEEEMDITMFEGDGQNDGTGAQHMNGNDKSSNQMQAATEELSVEPEGIQIMIRTIPPDIGRVKIEEVCSKIPGFVYLALGDPMQKRNYYRCGWIRFSDEVNIPEVVSKLGEAKIDGFRMQVSHSTRPFVSRTRMAPSVASHPERIKVDLENIRKLAGNLETQADELAQTSFDGIEVDAVDAKDRGSLALEARLSKLSEDLDQKFPSGEEEKMIAKKNAMAMDLYLAYLRTAFHCCYYCTAITDHGEELLRKCIKHGRNPPSIAGDWKETRWLQWLDSKVELLINRDNVDPTEHGGRSNTKELAKICEPLIRREDEGKFRCSICSKLFKAESFVEKHIGNKHPEVVTPLEEIPFFNMFALDPHRIQPFAHAPPPNGNQQPPPQAYGLKPIPREREREREYYNGGGFPADMHRQPYGHMPYPPLPPMTYSQYGEYPPPDAYYRRRPSPGRRRLSDRLGDRMFDQLPMVLTGSEGLPPKPSTFAEPMTERVGDEKPLPPPAKIKEDPRAASGRRVSYLDMDNVAEGDVELNY